MPARKSKLKKNENRENIIHNSYENRNNNINKVNNNSKPNINKIVNVTLAGFCAVCWNKALYYCSDCCLVGYCCLSHMASHWEIHQKLCCAAEKIIKRNLGSLYGSKITTPNEWRYSRIKILEDIKALLQQNLDPYERDLVLFPKHCSSCYETNYKKLNICEDCRQVWYCSNNSNHLPTNHSKWCKKLQLFATLVQKQAQGKLFMYDMNFGKVKLDELQINTNDNIEKAIKQVVKYELDDCQIAMISQACSGPLTILYAMRLLNIKVKKSLTIHLIGAELHYEGSTLQAWESFFMHFLPEISNLKIIMVGPELNAKSTCETIRLCEGCKIKNKILSFEYKDGLLYHEYATSKKFTKPDIVCALNPGLHRSTGFNQNDTWPHTIHSAVSNNCPFIFTAYTSYEAPLDLKRVLENAQVHVLHQAKLNPFASLKPDRNFISDHEAPLIFKNFYMSIVTHS